MTDFLSIRLSKVVFKDFLTCRCILLLLGMLTTLFPNLSTMTRVLSGKEISSSPSEEIVFRVPSGNEMTCRPSGNFSFRKSL